MILHNKYFGSLLNITLLTISIDSCANQITISNQLNSASACPLGNSVTAFYLVDNQSTNHKIEIGESFTITGDYSTGSGFGLQVNNWYWTSIPLPVEKGADGKPQNPDNSGAQFTLNDNCDLNHDVAVFGKGIPTYLIANVTASKNPAGGCSVTLTNNNYTDAVTPQCCAPPIFPTGICKGPWGVTNTDQAWPPN